jgi:hypothetical protein
VGKPIKAIPDPPQPAKTKYVWTNDLYWRFYRLAMEGLNDQQMCAVVGVTPNVFTRWKEKRPSLAAGIKEAREERKSLKNNLSGFLFDRLSPETREVWDRLMTAWQDDSPASRERKLRAVLDGKDEATMKHLFLHALVHSQFNATEAMKQVGVTQRQVKRWAESDPQFVEAVDEIETHKKNFYESKLVNLVSVGDPAAVMFVNRTYNADRGYSPKQQVEVSSTVHHHHSGQVTLDAIAPLVSVEVLEQIHRAVLVLKSRNPEALPPRMGQIVEQDGDILEATNEN